MAKRGGNEALKDEEKRKLNRRSLNQLLGVFKFALPYKAWFTAGLVALGLSSITLLGFPYLAGKLLDIASGTPVPFFNSINQVALALFAVLFLQGLFPLPGYTHFLS